MSLLERYRSLGAGTGFDELTTADGALRPGWAGLRRLAQLSTAELAEAKDEVARQLADRGVTYIPSPSGAVSLVDDLTDSRGSISEPMPWQLDAVPLLLGGDEWHELQAGLEQRAALLHALVTDLYGERRVLADRLLPAATVFHHPEYLRPLVGVEAAGLLLAGVDLGRNGAGDWVALSDRTQAPSGAGYAMQNRRVLSRVLPDLFHDANLARLTPFFSALRQALVDAAPRQVEDPRVVLLSPGAHSETAYDQAFVASLLGFPLVEGPDLVVRDGRLWMRVLDRFEQVDVLLRRVDSLWCDPLELQGGSELGVTGLVECVRRGTVGVVNQLGSGIVENPALFPYLPGLAEALLGEPLLLRSAETWWCGDAASLSHVLTHLDSLVIRRTSRSAGRSVRTAALTAAQRDQLIDRIRSRPHEYVGQEVLDLSVAPSVTDHGVEPRTIVLRSFAVRRGERFQAMQGGLASTGSTDARLGLLLTSPDTGASKDVWVVADDDRQPRGPITVTSGSEAWAGGAGLVSQAMVPHVLSNLYWMGRYGERTEGLLRMILATGNLSADRDQGTASAEVYRRSLGSLTQMSWTVPGVTAHPTLAEEVAELRSLLTEINRGGSVASSLTSLAASAQGVRDQLSDDVWMVLAGTERARASLAGRAMPTWQSVVGAAERMLTGVLALSGIVTENMVRDPGWYMLDTGRGIERALQVLRLLEVSLVARSEPQVESQVVETVLTAAESGVTYRRRQRGRITVAGVVDLLVVAPDNPRSVGYQLHRVRDGLLQLPQPSNRRDPVASVDILIERVRGLDCALLSRSGPSAVRGEGAWRENLGTELTELQEELRMLSDLIYRTWHQRPSRPRPLSSQWPSMMGG